MPPDVDNDLTFVDPRLRIPDTLPERTAYYQGRRKILDRVHQKSLRVWPPRDGQTPATAMPMPLSRSSSFREGRNTSHLSPPGKGWSEGRRV